MKKEKITKIIEIISLFLMVIVLSGCAGKENVQNKMKNEKKIVKEKKGLITGLKDSIKNGVTMKCVSNNSEEQWTTYINGKNIRSEGTNNGEVYVVLVKDGTTYTWTKGNKKGQKMDKKCIEEFKKDMKIEGNMENIEKENKITVNNLTKDEEEGKVKCSPSTKGDFLVPSDVEFTDQCQILKQQMLKFKNQIQKIKK